MAFLEQIKIAEAKNERKQMTKGCLYLLLIWIVLAVFIIVFRWCSPMVSKKPININLGENEKVGFISLNTDSNEIYYLSIDQSKIKKYSIKQKRIDDVLDLNLDNIVRVNFSPDFSKVIIQKFDPYQGIRANFLYTLSTQEKKELSNNFRENAWSPDSSKIAYRYRDWDRNIDELFLASPDAINIKKITDLGSGVEGIELDWINNEKISYYAIPAEENIVPAFVTDINSLTENNITKDGKYTGVKFFGEKGLATILATDQKSETAVIDSSGNLIKKLDINADLTKTIISGNILFVAAPDSNGGSLYQINIDSVQSKQLFKSSAKDKFSITNFVVDPQNKIVYFLSNAKLFKLKYE